MSQQEPSHLPTQAPPDVMREIKEEKITINFHEHCLTPSNFTRSHSQTQKT